MKMKAAIFRAINEPLTIEEVDIADPGPNEVRVKLTASGLCHTDLETMHGQQLGKVPMILGHEGAGVVESVGAGVTRVKPGDHVVCSWNPNCGHCFYCQRGQPILCEVQAAAAGTGGLLDGTSRLSQDGETINHYSFISSHAEYCVVPEQGAVPIHSDMSLELACLLGCAVMTGYGGAVRCAQVEPGSSVVVFGCGAVGLNAIQGARIAGASIIVGVDISASKLDLARAAGATHIVDAGSDDPVEYVQALTDGRGADYAIEAAGNETAIRHALEASRPGARIVLLGKTAAGASITLPFKSLMGERRIVRTSYGSARPWTDFPRLAELYTDGELLLDEFVTLRLSLEEINQGFAEMEDGNIIRAVVVFDA